VAYTVETSRKENTTMRLSYLVISLLMIAQFISTPARADLIDQTTYAIRFNVSNPGDLLPAAGSFAYDPDTHTFSSFFVTWDGVTLDLTSRANNPVIFITPACIGSLTGGAASFALLSGACDSPAIGEVTVWSAAASRAGGPAGLEFLTGDQACLTGPTGCNVFFEAGAVVGAGATERATGQGTWSIAAVPEPSSLVLLLPMAGPLIWRARKRSSMRS